MNNHLFYRAKRLFLITFISLGLNFSYAQSGIIKGTVNDEDGEPLIGATILVEELNTGTVTDFDGKYILENLKAATYTLTFSYAGYKSQTKSVEVSGTITLDIVLGNDVLQLDEVVVTGVFNQKSKLESSVSITTLAQEDVELLAPVSAVDALKNVPGVYVNDANGETRNEIQSRGLTTEFFALQEDGLQASISEFTPQSGFGRDFYLRSDIMTQRVEAVRGGSASITAANAPGGIFNYITRTGGNKLEGEVRTRLGLQGDSQEPYAKLEAFVSGPLSKDGWKFAIGGHYRHDEGNRPSEYPLSTGGQLKANVSKLFGKNQQNSIKIYGKYLDDRTGLNPAFVVSNWNNIQPAPGFTWTDNFTIPDVEFRVLDGFNFRNDPTATRTFRSRDRQRLTDKSIGANLTLKLGDRWTLRNHAKFSKKGYRANLSNGGDIVGPDHLFLESFASIQWILSDWNQTKLGVWEFYDVKSGEVLAQIDKEPSLFGGPFDFIQNDLPQGKIQNALVALEDVDITEIVDQFTLSGQFGNHTISFGGYFHLADNFNNLNSLNTRYTVEQNPQLVGIRVNLIDYAAISAFVPDLRKYNALSNRVAQYSDESGASGFNSAWGRYYFVDEQVLAVYANEEWQINDRINLDAGFRYESVKHKGGLGIFDNEDPNANPGGFDGDTLTIYDAGSRFFSGEYDEFDYTYNSFSWSAGLNYLLSDNSAIYGRFSVSDKIPNSQYFNFADIRNRVAKRKQGTLQAELGYKYTSNKIGVFAIAYYSELSNLAFQQQIISAGAPEGFYFTPLLFNSLYYIGGEVEVNYSPTKWFTLRSSFNLSRGVNKKVGAWEINDRDDPNDDVIIDLSGQPVAGASTRKYDFSPVDMTGIFYFNKKKGSFFVNWWHFSDRWANEKQAFVLPKFDLFKIGASYEFSKHFSLQLNASNIFNTRGILKFNGLTQLGVSANTLDKQYTLDNPDEIFRVQPVLPRAFYMTASYKF